MLSPEVLRAYAGTEPTTKSAPGIIATIGVATAVMRGVHFGDGRRPFALRAIVATAGAAASAAETTSGAAGRAREAAVARGMNKLVAVRDGGMVKDVVEKRRLLRRQEEEPDDVDHCQQKPAGANCLIRAVVREDVVDLDTKEEVVAVARGQRPHAEARE